ncbi:MAG: hypothetical protein DRQ88_04805 [Epsilonproteobacteria bacterium]|nr:MAG: hypothetical protein DRQ88_04805 [Campylobacterota bacterium]
MVIFLINLNKYKQKILLSLLGVIFSFSCQASVQSLVREFLAQNYFLKANKQNVKRSNQIWEELWASKTWWLDVEGGYQNNQQSDLFLQSPIDRFKGTFSRFQFSIKKEFNWGGSFNFDNQFFLHKWLIQLNQGVAYSQDLGKNFFGQSFHQELKMARITETETQARVNKENQGLLLKFFQLYNLSRLNKTLMSLHKKAKVRAVKRKENVVKRVNAGLLEKVDLYKSKMNVIAQEQAVRRAEIGLADNIEGLSGLLNRQVKDNEINSFKFDNLRIEKDMLGDTEDNFSLEKLKQEKLKINENLRKIDYSFIPQIKLNISYKSIGEISKESQDIFEGIIGTPSYVYGLAINLFMPLTFEPEEVNKSIMRIEQNKNLYTISGVRYELKYREVAQKRKLKIIRKNITSSIQRRRLSYKALKFQSDLYFHGRTELDIVLISERDIVFTEIALAQYVTRLEGNLAELSKIYGKLKEWVLVKKD